MSFQQVGGLGERLEPQKSTETGDKKFEARNGIDLEIVKITRGTVLDVRRVNELGGVVLKDEDGGYITMSKEGFEECLASGDLVEQL